MSTDAADRPYASYSRFCIPNAYQAYIAVILDGNHCRVQEDSDLVFFRLGQGLARTNQMWNSVKASGTPCREDALLCALLRHHHHRQDAAASAPQRVPNQPLWSPAVQLQYTTNNAAGF